MFQYLVKIFLFLSVFTISERFASFTLGGLPISSNKAFTGMLLLLVIARSAVRPLRPPPSSRNLWAVALGLGAIPSFVTSFILGGGVASVVNASLTIYSLLLFYFLVAITVRDRKDLDLVVWAAFLGIGLTIVTTLAGVNQDTSYYGRTGGLTGNPNLSAVYSVMGIGLGIYLFLEKPTFWRRALTGGVIFAGLLAIVQTGSRAGLISLAGMLGLIAVRARRLDLIAYSIPAIVIAGIGLYYLAPESYFERIGTLDEQAGDLAAGSLENTRIKGWWWALKAFANYPLTGVGLRTFHHYMVLTDPSVTPTTPHSSYLRVLSTMGLVGFVPWIMIVATTWLDYSRVRAWGQRMRGDAEIADLATLATFLQAVLFAWMVAGLVSPFDWDKGMWLTFGLATALVGYARTHIRAGSQASGEEPTPSTGGVESPFDPRGRLPSTLPPG